MSAPDTSWAKSAALLDAVETFLAAHKAAQEAFSNLSRAQISGPDPIPPQVEYLRDEAQHAWDVVATGWAESLIPAEAREVGAEYARPKPQASGHVVAPSFGSWQESVGKTDWSRSGRAA